MQKFVIFLLYYDENNSSYYIEMKISYNFIKCLLIKITSYIVNMKNIKLT